MNGTAGQKFTVAHEGPLLKYLYEVFPGQSKTGVKNMLSKGQVLVNGEQKTAFDHPLHAGDALLVLPKAISMARESSADAREEVEKTGVKIDGTPWQNLKQPVKLDEAAFPVRIIRKQARGTVTLLPAEDFARLELDDHQDGSASYRIEFGTK